MKNTRFILTALVVASLFSAVLFTACTKSSSTPNPCASVSCQNGGTCSNGTCTCPTGYTDSYCQTPVNAAFAGNWIGSNCNGAANYTLFASPDPSQLTFSLPLTFSSCGTTYTAHFTATIVSTSVFSTNTISVNDGCGNIYSLNGTGSLIGGTLKITFNIANNSTVTQCVFTGTK